MKASVNRYSDPELEEFRQLIEEKLTKASRDLKDLSDQILEITANTEDDFGTDWMDDSSTASELELLNDMAIRQRKYIQELQNALVRIKNKTYGICVVTGELIDKKRLLAVPTTTKSLQAKTLTEEKPAPVSPAPAIAEEDAEEEKPVRPREPRIITKVIRKSPVPGAKPPQTELDEVTEEDLLFPPSDEDSIEDDDLFAEGEESDNNDWNDED